MALSDSIFGTGWFEMEEVWKIDESLVQDWDAILALREVVLMALEKARVSKYIGSSLEANVVLYIENLDLIEKVISDSNKVDDLR